MAIARVICSRSTVMCIVASTEARRGRPGRDARLGRWAAAARHGLADGDKLAGEQVEANGGKDEAVGGSHGVGTETSQGSSGLSCADEMSEGADSAVLDCAIWSAGGQAWWETAWLVVATSGSGVGATGGGQTAASLCGRWARRLACTGRQVSGGHFAGDSKVGHAVSD